MSVQLYFGLPGSGKSSFGTFLIYKECQKIIHKKSKYKRIYTNIPIDFSFPFLYVVDYDYMKKYDLGAKSLLMIDEAGMEFDSRGFKNFGQNDKLLFLQHRRSEYDIVVFNQQWDGIDKKVRDITDTVYYVHRGVLFKSLSYANKIPYKILFPDEDSARYGDIIMGYGKAGIFARIFAKRFWRPSTYMLYGSYVRPNLPVAPCLK